MKYRLFIKINKSWIVVDDFKSGREASQFKQKFFKNDQIWSVNRIVG